MTGGASQGGFVHPSPFKTCQHDKATFSRLMAKPEAAVDLAIYFTPRSGSSWLTQALQASGDLGQGGEFFNPNFIPKIAQKMGAATLDEYIQGARRKLHTKGVFSFEITYYQLKKVFETEGVFFRYFGNSSAIWLVRKDIVAQAVSLAKKDRTKIGHSTQLKETTVAEAESLFEYDVDLIKKWLKHILTAEVKTERFFSTYGIKPLRICYEDMMDEGAAKSVMRIARHIDHDEATLPSVTVLPEKLGTSQNEAYADRFRRDAAGYVSEVAETRQKWIDALAG